MRNLALAEQKQIHDLILENFHHSLSFLTEFFGLEKPTYNDLQPFSKVLASLRALPREAMDDVVLPVLTAQFKAFGLDPTDATDRKKAAELSDLMALAIQDATQMIMQVMQQQHANAAKLMAGQGNLIR